MTDENIDQIFYFSCTYTPVSQDCVCLAGQDLPLHELYLVIRGVRVCVEIPHPTQLLQELQVYTQFTGQQFVLHLFELDRE